VRLKEVSEAEARHPRQLRQVNMDRVLAAAMTSAGPLTRAEITAATGLSAPTVGSLTAELVRLGLLSERGRGPSTGGRRPHALQFDARFGVVAGIVLDEAATRLAVADLAGETLAATEVATPPDDGPEPMLAWMGEQVQALLADARVPSKRPLLAVAVGLPGATDRGRGTVVGLMPGFRSWEGLPVGASLERQLGAPVVVENDVNLAVLGEHWRGAAQAHDTCVFISLGVGIGAGILIGGELHRGQHSLAGEIAVMCMGSQFLTEDFGSRGCLETLVGVDAIVRGWRPEAREDLARQAQALLGAARAGDAAARQAIGDAATLIGMAAASLGLVIDPSLLVLNGPLVEDGGDVLQQVRSVVSRIIPRPPKVVCSTLGDRAMLQGSLLVATREARERLRGLLRDPRRLRNLHERLAAKGSTTLLGTPA
jgi:predicted NBD/HSP70 family sugar kinase